MRLAAKVFPFGRQEWAAAMHAELQGIENDCEALRWAIGCLRTGLRERCRLGLLDLRVARWTVALWAIYQVEGNLCDAFLVLSYKLGQLGITQFLSRCTGSKDYHPLVSLFDATAVWEPSLCLVGGALYLLGVVAVLRRSHYAFALFLSALLGEVSLWLYELTKPLFVAIYSSADLVHDTLLYTVTALLVLALWQDSRISRRSMS